MDKPFRIKIEFRHQRAIFVVYGLDGIAYKYTLADAIRNVSNRAHFHHGWIKQQYPEWYEANKPAPGGLEARG